MIKFTKVFNTTSDSMESVIPWLMRYVKQKIHDEPSLLKIEVAIEEIFVNIMNHAYQKQEMPVFVELTLSADLNFISFRDFGSPFDPLDPILSKNFIKNLEDAPIGGQGLKFIKAAFPKITYFRESAMNVIRCEF